MGRKKIKRGAKRGSRPPKDFVLADEIGYIQARAALRDPRLVRVNSLALFSTESGDAWLLDPRDHTAARLARDGEPEELYFEENEAQVAIGWKGSYRIEGNAFLYTDRESNRLISIEGYPTGALTKLEE